MFKAFKGLNAVINELHEAYRGFHILYFVCFCKAFLQIIILFTLTFGKGRVNKKDLQTYFKDATLPAAVKLLLCSVNESQFIATHVPIKQQFQSLKANTMLAVVQYRFRRAHPPIP
jgi:hypothetical protein